MVSEKRLVSETIKNYSYLENLNEELKQIIIGDSKKHTRTVGKSAKASEGHESKSRLIPDVTYYYTIGTTFYRYQKNTKTRMFLKRWTCADFRCMAKKEAQRLNMLDLDKIPELY